MFLATEVVKESVKLFGRVCFVHIKLKAFSPSLLSPTTVGLQ